MKPMYADGSSDDDSTSTNFDEEDYLIHVRVRSINRSNRDLSKALKSFFFIKEILNQYYLQDLLIYFPWFLTRIYGAYMSSYLNIRDFLYPREYEYYLSSDWRDLSNSS